MEMRNGDSRQMNGAGSTIQIPEESSESFYSAKSPDTEDVIGFPAHLSTREPSSSYMRSPSSKQARQREESIARQSSKRLRHSAPSSRANDGDGSSMIGERLTKDEVTELEIHNSQSILDELSISQQATQEFSQTLEDSEAMHNTMLVKLHPDVERSLTAEQHAALRAARLDVLDMNRHHSNVQLGRDVFARIFSKHTSPIDPVRLSRTHAVFDYLLEESAHLTPLSENQEMSPQRPPSRSNGKYALYVTDCSTNGIRVNGQQVPKRTRQQVEHGDTITLLSNPSGRVLLGYIVEDPHIKGAAIAEMSNLVTPADKITTEVRHASENSESSQVTREFLEYTLGVLFAVPLVGKDIHGRYHPIPEIGIKREYTILQESLLEAARYGKMRSEAFNQQGDGQALFEVPRHIRVSAKFASSENFRSVVTLGCRALHFSGHGDEHHLYFEDGAALVHPIPHSGLQKLFSAGSLVGGEPPLRLVFVSACSSASIAKAFVTCGIPHVVGVREGEKIEDHAAIEFTRSFYLALAAGKAVGSSYHIAQEAVASSPNIKDPIRVSNKFMLLPEDGDHSEVIFPPITMRAMASQGLGSFKKTKAPKLWFDDLPGLCQGFSNRTVEVYKISEAILANRSKSMRLASITGAEGIGKTAVAHAVINYVGPRFTTQGNAKVFAVDRIVREELEAQSIALTSSVGRPSSAGRTLVLPRLKERVQEYLMTRSQKAPYQKRLILLDGCDYFLRSDERKDSFRMFLSDLLTNSSELKVLLTARQSVTTDGSVTGHGEKVFQLSPFSPKFAARMLVAVASRPIRIEELSRAKEVVDSDDKIELLANHPVLVVCKGLPKRIADLAGKLNVMQMDEIVVDEGGS